MHICMVMYLKHRDDGHNVGVYTIDTLVLRFHNGCRVTLRDVLNVHDISNELKYANKFDNNG